MSEFNIPQGSFRRREEYLKPSCFCMENNGAQLTERETVEGNVTSFLISSFVSFVLVVRNKDSQIRDGASTVE